MDRRAQQRGYRDHRGGPQEQFVALEDSPAHDSVRQNTRSTRNHTLDQRYELCRFRLRLVETHFLPTFLEVRNSLRLFRRYLPCHRDGEPGRPLGITPDLLLYQSFKLGCEDRKLKGRPRWYYRIILGREWLNVCLRRNHRFQR